MLNVSDPKTIRFEDIDIDPFWNTGDEREHRCHRIHAYPAKFPAFLTKKAIKYAESKGITVRRIVDVFCGCGTVAFEAKRLGIDFWGCDLSPTAVLIARAKSAVYNYDLVMQYYDSILSRFDGSYRDFPEPQVVNERIAYWFLPQQIRDLELLKQCILEVTPSRGKYRDFFLCAFSNILKPTSQWLTKSVKPQIDPHKKPLKVRDAFVFQFEVMRRAIAEASFPHSSSVTIERRNALTVRKQDFADLIITSPPYVTSYEYADLHQLSTLWLGYADDYRVLRRNSIGSSHGKVVERDYRNLNETGRCVVDQLSQVDPKKARTVAKYYLDIEAAVRVCRSILRTNGMLLMVIGNTEYKGVCIDNVRHLCESLLQSGFDAVDVTKRRVSGKILTPYRDEKGRFTSTDDKRQVYAEEYIVIAG